MGWVNQDPVRIVDHLNDHVAFKETAARAAHQHILRGVHRAVRQRRVDQQVGGHSIVGAKDHVHDIGGLDVAVSRRNRVGIELAPGAWRHISGQQRRLPFPLAGAFVHTDDIDATLLDDVAETVQCAYEDDTGHDANGRAADDKRRVARQFNAAFRRIDGNGWRLRRQGLPRQAGNAQRCPR